MLHIEYNFSIFPEFVIAKTRYTRKYTRNRNRAKPYDIDGQKYQKCQTHRISVL